MQNIILYGAAYTGNLMKGILEKSGFCVLGYIDKRAFELKEYKGLPVWDLDSVPEEYRGSEVAIFISIKNVFEHEQVAAMLSAKGFKKIVYKPYNALLGFGTDAEKEVSAIYDSLMAGNNPKDMTIPDYLPTFGEEMHDFAFVREIENQSIVAYIPVEFVFTNNAGGKWDDIGVTALFTHIDFFRFLGNHGDADPKDYIYEYCISGAAKKNNIDPTAAWRDNVFQNRAQVYEEMCDAMNLDPDFFVRNAAKAEWNDKNKHFNLLSGKHRCCFLAAKGRKYIPLCITKEDYQKFLHADKVADVVQQLARETVEVIIPHPYFYRGSFSRDRGEWEFLLWFARYFGRKTYHDCGQIDFSKLNILDYSADFGNFARFSSRLGCHVNRQKMQGKLEKQLNQLFYSTVQYPTDMDALNVTHQIVVIEAEHIQAEQEQMQKILNGEETALILKYSSRDVAEEFARAHSLQIKAVINRRYEKGVAHESYLLGK